MLPHEDRMLSEENELSAKVRRLTTFINGPLTDQLSGEDVSLMESQKKHMESYLQVLRDRIDRFQRQYELMHKGQGEPVDGANFVVAAGALGGIEDLQLEPGEVTPVISGVKYDGGKNRIGLMMQDFGLALIQVANCTTHGAVKYGPSNWLDVEDAEMRYLDAFGRHFMDHVCGIPHDGDSGLPHLAQAAWNLLALLELEIERNGLAPLSLPGEE